MGLAQAAMIRLRPGCHTDIHLGISEPERFAGFYYLLKIPPKNSRQESLYCPYMEEYVYTCLEGFYKQVVGLQVADPEPQTLNPKP